MELNIFRNHDMSKCGDVSRAAEGFYQARSTESADLGLRMAELAFACNWSAATEKCGRITLDPWIGSLVQCGGERGGKDGSLRQATVEQDGRLRRDALHIPCC